ncbi:MAG: 60Kd inner membrane protein-domain-containing protein, partial [Benjaminiella poitrasii]
MRKMNRSILQWTSQRRKILNTITCIQKSSPHFVKHSVSFSCAHSKEKAKYHKSSLASAATPSLIADSAILTNTSDSNLPAILAANESIFFAIHNTGLPWWVTIVTSTLLLRSAMTLPIAIYQQRSIAKMINLAPMIQSWAETLKVQVAKDSNSRGWHYQQYNSELQKQYRKKVKSIYAHYGCPRWKILLLPWIQIPLFVSMSLTLRHLTAFPLPWLGKTAEMPALGLSEEGLAWFMDLTAADPTMMVPVLIGAGNLINIEV